MKGAVVKFKALKNRQPPYLTLPSSYVRMLLPVFQVPTSGLACALFVYSQSHPLSETHLSHGVRFCESPTFSKHLKTFYFESALSALQIDLLNRTLATTINRSSSE